MKPKMETRFISLLKIVGMIVVLFVIAAILIFAIWRASFVSWTGFGDFTTPTGEFIRGKTVWDWMGLLVIPLTLLIGGYILNRSEREIERKIASDGAELEREIAKDRQREQAFQAYIDRMSDLLLEKKLRTTEEAEVKDIARTRTLSVLRGLDSRRKGQVVQFLYEAKLLTKKNNIVNLQGADLEGADLQGVKIFKRTNSCFGHF